MLVIFLEFHYDFSSIYKVLVWSRPVLLSLGAVLPPVLLVEDVPLIQGAVELLWAVLADLPVGQDVGKRRQAAPLGLLPHAAVDVVDQRVPQLQQLWNDQMTC